MLACIFKGNWTSIKTFQTPCYYHDSWRWSWSQSDDQCPRCLFCCWCTCGLWGNFYQVNKSPHLIINILDAFWLVVAFSCSLGAALVRNSHWDHHKKQKKTPFQSHQILSILFFGWRQSLVQLVMIHFSCCMIFRIVIKYPRFITQY